MDSKSVNGFDTRENALSFYRIFLKMWAKLLILLGLF